MEPQLQRRIQRYGWDLAVDAYARHWHAPLAGVQAETLACAAPAAGERVLDVACGTGIVSLAAAHSVGAGGHVLGVDLSGAMVQAAQARAQAQGVGQAFFARMDAGCLTVPVQAFDVALCVLGLMYLPDPAAALRELFRALRPGGRIALAVWGERVRCGWAPVLEIIDAEVRSDVCPLFFSLGTCDALPRLCETAGFLVTAVKRRTDTLHYDTAQDACGAAFAGGPVALAWSRFDAQVRARVCARYVEAISPWRVGRGYRLPAEFVVVAARRR